MMKRRGISACFCDTSFFYATLDNKDHDHPAAATLADWVQANNVSLFTTWEVVLETVTLLRYRYSYQGSMAFIEEVLPHLNLIQLTSEDRINALEIFKKFSKDKQISLCDAISYVVVRDYLNFAPCLAFDEDFEQMGLTVLSEVPF